jgi:N utilization substance protein B
MSNMHKIRELAMQVLFLWDANGELDLALGWQATQVGDLEESLRMRSLQMAEGTWSQKDMIDAWVERLAPQWPPRRQPGVDRNILRLGVWELTSTETPPKVVIDEAIELAKEFSTEQSSAFVNGVLDAVLREKTALTAVKPESVEEVAKAEAGNADDGSNPEAG